MNTVIVENCKTLFIGRRGENEVTEVVFDFTEWQEQFGTGVIDLYVKRNLDVDAYPVVLSVDGTVATWIVTDADTAVVGSGKIEFVYTVDQKVAKSAIFPFYVGEDIGQASSEPPDPYESWIETLTELGTETQANAQAAAQSASDAADSAASASESAGQAEDSAEDAEAWAVGERNGEPVSVGDETYENNAKYWAEKAKTDAPVTSVNGKTGDIVLDLDDIPNGETFARATPEQLAQIGKNAADIADIDEMIPNTTSESNPLVNVSFLTNRLTSYRTSAAQDTIDAGKQDKITAYGILKRDRSGNITGAIAGTDYLTADALNGYRKASAQDAIDNAQNQNIDKNTAAINTMQPAATAADIGKALIVKTVADGKPTSYEYGKAGGGGSALTAGDGIDITDDVISNTQGIEYIVGTQAGSTASWKGNSTDETLKVGKIIAYYLPFAGSSLTNATLTLTMAGGAQTAAIPLRRTGTSAVTNQFAAGNVIILIYDGTYWRVSAYYDQNDNTVPTGYCLSPAATAAKAATCSYGYRGDTNYFPCLFRYANTATDATLAITTYAPEAAPIYVNGERTSASNTFSAGVILFLYYNGAYYCYNDGRFPILVDGTVTSVQEYAAGLLVNYRTAAAQDTIDSGKQAKITATGILKGDGAGGVSSATAGTDYATPQQVNEKYAKPSGGIPSTDMTAAVQASLSKADTALQAVPDTYRTAADQDVIDNEQDDRLDAVEQATTATTIGPVALATFDASAANMPLKGLTVNIEPVQNLNGYDHPWPEGGGKNLLKYPYETGTVTKSGVTFTVYNDGSIKVDTAGAAATANADLYFFSSKGPLPLSNGDYIFSSTYDGTLPSDGFYIHAKANASDASYLNISIGDEGLYTVSNGVFYTACIRVLSGRTINNVTVRPMLRLATEEDATFEPYSNICPITGWTGCNVTQTGKNLLSDDPSNYISGYIDASGNEVLSTGSIYTFSNGYIPVNPSEKYTVSAEMTQVGTSNFAISIAFYKADKSFIERPIAWGPSHITGRISGTVTSPADAKYCRVNIWKSSIGKDFQLERGAVMTDYEPYQGDTYTITFPTEAGTVYGGTLDVASKKLTVTKVAHVFTGTETFREDLTNALGYILSPAALVTGNGSTTKADYLLCSHLTPSLTYLASAERPNKMCLWKYGDNVFAVLGYPAGIESVARYKTYLQQQYSAGTPVTVAYTLASPIEIPLSSIPEITTLLGTNNIWADCGDVTVTYGAYLDAVKAYADKVGDSILSAIAPLETTYTASRGYAAGSFLFVGTKFYKVTAAISSGDTITPDTNVTQTTIAEQLMALANV